MSKPDPERVEEPRPDRLPDIRQRLAYIGVWYGGDPASRVDVAWLVAEVERLRARSARIQKGHTEGCAINYPVDGPCTCGFTEAWHGD